MNYIFGSLIDRELEERLCNVFFTNEHAKHVLLLNFE